MRSIRPYAVLACVLPAVLALAAQDGALLKRTLKPNSTETYSVITKINTVVELPGGLGDQEMVANTASTLRLQLGSVDDAKGVAKVVSTLTVDKIDSEGMLSALGSKTPPPVTQMGTIDSKGAIRLEKPKKSGDLMSMLGGDNAGSPLLIVLPDKPVKIGDSWPIAVPKPGATGNEQTLTAKLVGEKMEGAHSVWVVQVSGTVNMDTEMTMPSEGPDGTPNPIAGKKAHIKSKSDVAAEGLVDKATGQIVRLDAKTKSTQNLSIAEMGMSVDSTSTVTSLVQLKS